MRLGNAVLADGVGHRAKGTEGCENHDELDDAEDAVEADVDQVDERAGSLAKLAKRFVDTDFYSMSPRYTASTTTSNWSPTYSLSINIDGQPMKIEDYSGQFVGMPTAITDLEEAVDDFARTSRWIEGADGLVDLLKTEKYNFKTLEAQIVLKRAAAIGQTATVQQLLAAGVSLQPLPPKPEGTSAPVFFNNASWLHAAALHSDTLQVLIDAKASKDDQNGKDLALAGAAAEGNIASVHSLLAYGANPNADLSQFTQPETVGGMSLVYPSSGSIQSRRQRQRSLGRRQHCTPQTPRQERYRRPHRARRRRQRPQQRRRDAAPRLPLWCCCLSS
jgi:hypothetical protein